MTRILIEYSAKDVAQNSFCDIWGPRFTDGISIEDIGKVHSVGKKVIPWTVDMIEYIESFMNYKKVDGILSNYPSLVAARYWSRENL